MSMPNPFDLLIEQIRQAVREELRKALGELAPEKANNSLTEKEWARAEELAKMYDLPKTLFEEKGREGKIKRTKPGRHVLFNVPDVERFLRSHQTGGGKNRADD